MPDFARYVGLPYSPRLDCYGLVRKVLGDAGVEIPDYDYPADTEGRACFVRDVEGAWQHVERPRLLDVVLLNIKGVPRHVGIVVGRGQMLHTDADFGSSRIERYDSPLHSVAGFYRWPSA